MPGTARHGTAQHGTAAAFAPWLPVLPGAVPAGTERGAELPVGSGLAGLQHREEEGRGGGGMRP